MTSWRCRSWSWWAGQTHQAGWAGGHGSSNEDSHRLLLIPSRAPACPQPRPRSWWLNFSVFANLIGEKWCLLRGSICISFPKSKAEHFLFHVVQGHLYFLLTLFFPSLTFPLSYSFFFFFSYWLVNRALEGLRKWPFFFFFVIGSAGTCPQFSFCLGMLWLQVKQ